MSLMCSYKFGINFGSFSFKTNKIGNRVSASYFTDIKKNALEVITVRIMHYTNTATPIHILEKPLTFSIYLNI